MEQRFWSKVVVSGWYDCWEWRGKTHRKGYGEFRVNGVPKRAHRISYEMLVGTIPHGLVLDHLCRNRKCVNPVHLDPVTAAENTRRGINSNEQKTHCKAGHAFNKENTRTRRDGGRSCRLCHRQWQAQWKARQPVRSTSSGLQSHR